MNKHNYQPIKQTKYYPLDAFKVFLWAVVLKQVASFLLVAILNSYSRANGIAFEELLNNSIVGYLLLVSFHVVLLLLFVVYNSKHKFDVKKTCNINFKFDLYKVGVVALISVVSLFLVAPFINVLESLYRLIGYAPSNNLLFKLDTPLHLIISLVLVAFVPAVVEELIFRGVVLQGLLKKIKPHSAVLLSALFFTLLHGALQQTVYQFILGVVLGYVALFGGLNYAVLMHFLNNAIVLVVNYISPAVEESASIGLINIISAVLLLVAACALFYVLLNALKKGNKKHIHSDTELTNNSMVKTTKKKSAKKTKSIIKFNSIEMMYLVMSLAISCMVWLVNTLVNIN